jgi:uncharacterized membrane protein YcaP (DUF421 family)
MWHDMFYLGLPVLEKIVRPMIIYVFLVVGLRLAGKRELAQLNPFDFIVLLMLSNTVQNAIIGNDNSVTGGLIGAAALLLMNSFVVHVLFRHRRLARVVGGKRDYLIRDGQIIKDHLNRELMTRAELTAAAHKQGIESLEVVETAILEATGTITFIERAPTADEGRHQELLARIDALRNDVAALRTT